MKINLSSTRDYSLDNVRFILIFSVVFAHLLEVCAPFSGNWLIYKFIYTFHMPAFIFLFGYNAKYSPKKIIYRWCLPYVIFQCVYILFSNFILNTNTDFQFTTPYWILWYILACIYYQLLLPLFDTPDNRKQFVTILCAFVISLLIGYEESVGQYMSLLRFFVFQPWFLLGYYCKKNNLLEKLSLQPKRRFFVLLVSETIIVILFLFIAIIPSGLLYGSYSYSSCEGTLWMRGMVSIMSFAVILFLCVGMRPYLSRKLALITNIGQNTWPIFLLHGFVVKAIPIYFPYLVSSPWRVILLSCVIVIFAGNKLCYKIVYYICFSWLEKYLTNSNLNKELDYMDKETIGTVLSVTRQWWLKVNIKPIRRGVLDGATFPHIIKVQYVVDGNIYIKKKWIKAGEEVPAVGNRLAVLYCSNMPTKAKVL